MTKYNLTTSIGSIGDRIDSKILHLFFYGIKIRTELVFIIFIVMMFNYQTIRFMPA